MTTHCINLRLELHVKSLLAGATVLVLPATPQPDKRWGIATASLLRTDCPFAPGDTLIGRETWRWIDRTTRGYTADATDREVARFRGEWTSAAIMVKSVRPMLLCKLRVPDMEKMSPPGVWVTVLRGPSKRTLQQLIRIQHLNNLRWKWQQDYPKLPFNSTWVWRIEVTR